MWGRVRACGAAMSLLAAFVPATLPAQADSSVTTLSDSVMVAAGPRYATAPIWRFFLGNTYRDLWTTPVKVPIFDMREFEGGVRPVRRGGGLSTLTLRLVARDGREFVFRQVDKARVSTPYNLEGSLVDRIFRDQVSALHPAGAVITDPLLTAAGTRHPRPFLAFMPDDPQLGEFRADFANTLGMVEEYPNVPGDGPGFRGAHEIIDSDELLELLNKDPMHRVNGKAMLAARLMDILVSDNDRHAGQWKWARMDDARPVRWEPIPRDRDHAFVRFDGALIRLARLLAAPTLILFEGSDMNLEALTEHSAFDGRMLGELTRAEWDSVARHIVRQMTDSVIDAAIAMQPPEFRARSPHLARNLRERRDNLHATAMRWYRGLAGYPDVHATDGRDIALINRMDDRYVEIALLAPDGTPYYRRRFDAWETREIRIYLHGGNDSALVRGRVQHSVRVRVIGGNGLNSLQDSSHVADDSRSTLLYDQGMVDSVEYGEDTLFNRKHMIWRMGRYQPPGPDRGVRWVPRAGYRSFGRLGTTPMLGYRRYDYGFLHRPHVSLLDISAEYATAYRGWRVGLNGDLRFRGSPVHVGGTARMSDLEVVAFRGVGNQLTREEASSEYYHVRQRQWLLRPAVSLALGRTSDISLGPTLQYSVTDSTPNRFVSDTRPYGFGEFRQLGLRLNLRLNKFAGFPPPLVREGRATVFPAPLHRFQVDVDGIWYPAIWDVTSPFQSIGGRAGASVTLPLQLRTTLVTRVGGKVLFGRYPFHEAAFLGGIGAARSVGFQSFEGDASLYGSAELRMRVARFLFLLPFDAGPVVLADASRVYVDGTPAIGWNTAAGGGIWLGLRDSPMLVTLSAMNENGRVRFKLRSGLTF